MRGQLSGINYLINYVRVSAQQTVLHPSISLKLQDLLPGTFFVSFPVVGTGMHLVESLNTY